MANVRQYLEQILKARFGKDVRQSIHDSIDAINTQVTESEAGIVEAATAAQTAAENAGTAASNAQQVLTDTLAAQAAAEAAAINAEAINADLVQDVSDLSESVNGLSENVTQLNDDLTESLVAQKGLELFGYIAPVLPNGVKDTIENGVYHKRVNRVDLRSFTWLYQSTWRSWYTSNQPSDMVRPSSDNIVPNNVISNYVIRKVSDVADDSGTITDSGIGFTRAELSTNRTIVRNGSSSEKPSGYLYYELATEITRDINSANVLDTIGTTTNLLKITASSTVVNGVTFTVNSDDCTVTANGTATKRTNITLGNVKTKSGEKYKLCGQNGNAYLTAVFYSDSSYISYVECRKESIITVPSGASRITIELVVDESTSVNSVVKPMLTTNLSATYNDFVPFTGVNGTLNKDVADLTKIVKNVVNSGRFLCDVVSNQVNNIRVSDIDSGTFPSNPARCVYNVSGFYSNIDYNIKILSDSSRFIISPTITQRISISWIELF